MCEKACGGNQRPIGHPSLNRPVVAARRARVLRRLSTRPMSARAATNQNAQMRNAPSLPASPSTPSVGSARQTAEEISLNGLQCR
jgi:hypothetical protein